MVTEMILGGGVVLAVLGALEGLRGRTPASGEEMPAEAAIREAMRGEEAGAVLAEYRRRGTCLPPRLPVAGFFWGGWSGR